jgi:hypothetical protein
MMSLDKYGDEVTQINFACWRERLILQTFGDLCDPALAPMMLANL